MPIPIAIVICILFGWLCMVYFRETLKRHRASFVSSEAFASQIARLLHANNWRRAELLCAACDGTALLPKFTAKLLEDKSGKQHKQIVEYSEAEVGEAITNRQRISLGLLLSIILCLVSGAYVTASYEAVATSLLWWTGISMFVGLASVAGYLVLRKRQLRELRRMIPQLKSTKELIDKLNAQYATASTTTHS